jgi:hypothetical protein
MTKPATAPEATSALVPLGETGVTYNLDAFPEAQFNRLIPTQTIQMPSDLMVPVVQVVRLSVNEADKDAYSSPDIPNGHLAPTARGLSKLATAAGVSFYDERRVDDGKDPNVIAVSVMASMILPTGQRVTVPGSKRIDLGAQSWASDRQRAKYKSFFYEHVATRARNRAVRALLSLKSSYTLAELARPFAVVSFAPNMNHPEVRARIIDAMAPSVAQLYGPAAAPQLVAGDLQAPEAPDDDEAPVEGQARDVTEPSWFDAVPPGTAAPAAAAATPSPAEHLVTVLREAVAQSGVVGPPTAPQLHQLAEIFVAKGISRPETDAGLRIIFGVTGRADFTGAQAQALINASNAGDFPDLWREIVAGDGAQAA